MRPELRALAHRFRFNEKLVTVATEGFTPEDWARRPAPDAGNCAHWILGHVAQSRRLIARRLRDPRAIEPWERTFGMNSKPDCSPLDPGPEALAADFRASGARLEALFGDLDEEALRSEWGPRPFPDGTRSLAEGLSFLLFHETYHLGQLGLLRRICGKPGFI